MPKVSVIIPNYNHARYLPRRIDSVLAQTFTDFDVLLMDDASPDNSREIIARYTSDPKVRLLHNERNSGSTFKQWNKGIREAQGEYIWLAESDDYADPRLLERLVQLLDANPKVGVAYCQSYVIDADDNILQNRHDAFGGLGHQDHWDHDFISNGQWECVNVLVQQNMIPNASAVVFRKSLFEKVGGADESMRLCGDWKLWASMLLHSDLAYIAEPLNYYRTHTQNVRSKTRGWLAVCESMQVQAAIDRVARIDPSVLRRIRQSFADFWINNWLWKSMPEPELKAAAIKQIRAMDPYFYPRVVQRIAQRSVATLLTGRTWKWAGHVLRGRRN